RFAVELPPATLKLARPRSRLHFRNELLRNLRRGAEVALAHAIGLAADHPGLAAVPAIEIERAMAVEHHVHAALDLEVFEAGLQRERGLASARVAPHHRARVAHEAAEIHDRGMIGTVQIAPAHALLPGLHGALDRLAVERGRAAQELDLGGRLHRARVHQRVVRIYQY